MIKLAVRDSIRKKGVPVLNESIIQKSTADRNKKQKIAEARGIKPGSKRWVL